MGLKKVSIVLRINKKSDLEVKDYILQEADKLFFKYGFKSVTMDDIAKQLGISKKTIYQHFNDKNELVNLLIKEKISMQCCTMENCIKIANDAVHEIFMAIDNIYELLSQMNPKLFYDLQKYHTEAWVLFREFREKHMAKIVLRNLERGIDEGYYRVELNKNIITQMRLEQENIVFNQHQNYTMNKYTIAQVMAEITEHYLYGICNEKGLELINFYKAQNQKQV